MNNYSKDVADTIESIKDANPEELKKFREKILQTLSLVNEKLKSEDPQQRAEALSQALELKALFEKQVKHHKAREKKKPPIHLQG